MRWRPLDGGPWGLGGGYAWISTQHPCMVTLGPCEVVGKGPEGGQEGMAGHSPEASPPPALPRPMSQQVSWKCGRQFQRCFCS